MIKQLITTPIPVLVQQQREFFRTEQTQEIAFRLEQLAKLKQSIIDRQEAILQASKADLCRPAFEAYEERRNFFRQIGARLRPHGYLVSFNAAADRSTPAYKSLLEVSRWMFQYAEMPAEEIEKIINAYGQQIAILPPQEVEAMITSSEFNTPVLFFQTFLIHAWYAKRTQ